MSAARMILICFNNFLEKFDFIDCSFCVVGGGTDYLKSNMLIGLKIL